MLSFLRLLVTRVGMEKRLEGGNRKNSQFNNLHKLFYKKKVIAGFCFTTIC